MSNLQTSPATTTRLGRLALAAGVLAASLAASLAVGSAASAKTPDDGGKQLPSPQLPFQPAEKLPSKPDLPAFDIPGFDIPLPCFGWWCHTPVFLLPDYETSFDNVSSANSYYNGVPAVPYYVSIRNIGMTNPGAVWSTFASPDGEILGIEPVGSWRTDIVAAPLADTAEHSAPLAFDYIEDGWVVQDTNGIPTGSAYADKVYVRVWMAGWGRPELVVSANDHAGVEHLGATTPVGYRYAEVTRDNNRISFTL